MTVRLFKDVEEALEREVRRITFHDTVTLDKTVLPDLFDPFTGEVVQNPIEPSLYDSSADVGHINYPHFFIKLLKTRHDRFTAREVSQNIKSCLVPVRTSPRAYEIIARGDGTVVSIGSDLTTSIFTINKIQPGNLLRLLAGANIGTYKIASITADAMGDHTITVAPELVEDLPEFEFSAGSRTLIFPGLIDLNTVKVGDTFTDFSAGVFGITAVDADAGTIAIDGVATPDTSSGAVISRSGDIFTATDLTAVRFLILDQDSPIKIALDSGEEDITSEYAGMSAQIPLDLFYLIRIDNKEQCRHIEVLNRVWEEFNPPRTFIPVVLRSKLSAETELTEDVTSGGSTTIKVTDNSNFNVGDPVFIFDDLLPGKDGCGKALPPFESKVVDKVSTDELVLEDTVPDTFVLTKCPRIVSNAEFRTYFFHFVDHNTKDVEGSQYWVHEFSFWIQVWIDKNEDLDELSVVTQIGTPIETFDSGLIIDDC